MIDVKLNSGVQAFGMSITAGLSAVNPPNYWVNRVGAFLGGTVENRAVGGTGLPDMVRQAYTYMPYGGRTKLALADGPLNDIRQTGAATLPSIKPALDALVSTAFSGMVRSASHPSPGTIHREGIWASLGSSYGGRSLFFSGLTPMYTSDPAAAITFSFGGPTVCVHGFASETGDWVNLDIEVDGVAWGQTEWSCKARPGANKQPVATVIDGLSSGSHVIKVKPQTMGPGQYAVVDCIQTPYLPGVSPLMLGSIPNIQDWHFGNSIGTWSDAQDGNAIIEQVAADWATRGYPVAYVDLTSFIQAGRDFVSDGVHMTDRGQLNWALGYMSQIRVTP